MQHHDATAPSHPQGVRTGRTRSRRWRLGLLTGICALTLAASACTPEQVTLFRMVAEPYDEVLTDAQLHALRVCESGDDYTVVDRSGSFRGAYQFTRSTWDSVASRHFEWLVGVDPAEAEPWWQDLMARALWSERGRGPWPVCGRRI